MAWTILSDIDVNDRHVPVVARLTIAVQEASPFVYKGEVFQNIASPADMRRLPTAPSAGLWLDNSVDLVYRSLLTANESFSNMLENLRELEEALTSSSNTFGQVLGV
jgi:hypothetical protein